jgi:hypothetical protein
MATGVLDSNVLSRVAVTMMSLSACVSFVWAIAFEDATMAMAEATPARAVFCISLSLLAVTFLAIRLHKGFSRQVFLSRQRHNFVKTVTIWHLPAPL